MKRTQKQCLFILVFLLLHWTTIRCSWHRAKCSRCHGCSRCLCKCKQIERKKRSRGSGPCYNERNNSDEDLHVINDVPSIPVLELKSVAHFRVAFVKNDNVGRRMSIFAHRQTKEMLDMDHESRGRMVNYTVEVSTSSCEIIYPKGLRALELECAARLNNGFSAKYDYNLRENVNILATMLPPKSIQRLVLLSLVSFSYNSSTWKT